MTRHFSLDIDRDGIATLALDVPGAPLNMLSDEFVIQLDETIRALSSDAAVRGILVTSAKSAFAAGWNLLDLVNAIDTSPDAGSLHRATNGFSKVLRRLETCGKPVVAAINGIALGGVYFGLLFLQHPPCAARRTGGSGAKHGAVRP